MSCTTANLDQAAPAQTLSSNAMTIFAAAAAITFSASAAAPPPLYRHYQEVFGLAPATLTFVFAAYVFSLLAALLTIGSLSDYIGRRPVIFGALLLNMAAQAMFITADSGAVLQLSTGGSLQVTSFGTLAPAATGSISTLGAEIDLAASAVSISTAGIVVWWMT